MHFEQPPTIETEQPDLYLYRDGGEWVERPWVPEALLDDMASAGVIRGYIVEHVTGIPRWQGWKFRLVRHPASGEIVRVTATPPEGHTPRRDERRARDRFLKMVKETERWFESVDADPGAAPSRSMDIDMAAFLATLLPSPYHGHDRAEAAETVAALCRFAAAQDLEWRPLLAAIYRVSDRTVDTWMSEAHTAGLESLRRNQWRAAAGEKGDSGSLSNRTGPPVERTLTLVFTPTGPPTQTGDAGQPTTDVEITSNWSDGKPGPAIDPLKAVTLADTVAEQLRLTEVFQMQYPDARVRARLARPRECLQSGSG